MFRKPDCRETKRPFPALNPRWPRRKLLDRKAQSPSRAQIQQPRPADLLVALQLVLLPAAP
jgi:hypothetical protein